MPQTRSGARSRRLFVTSALAVVGLAALSGVAATISARPPSIPSPVPADAFKPVVVPGDDERLTWRASTPVLDPPPTSPFPPPTPEPSAPAGPVHIVRSGDTLSQIAAWHRADLDLVLRWNEGVYPRRLVAGQRILVPGGEPMQMPAPPSGTNGTISGGHLWPLPVRGTVTTRFSSAHPGIDIAAPAGTPVRAIAGGTVAWAGWKDTGGGYVVVIRHADGMVSTYNHNRKLVVRAGQVVARGDQIAEVGSTGWSTGPHLDLRIKMGGELIDPLRLDWAR